MSAHARRFLPEGQHREMSMRSCRYFGFLTCAASASLLSSCAFLTYANPAQTPPASTIPAPELKGNSDEIKLKVED